MEAIKEALKDGTIDVIATDHAPHHTSEKIQEFDFAPSGISGLETALPLALRLVEEGFLGLAGLVGKMALNPSEILGIDKGTLRPGTDADITIIDLKKRFNVNKELIVSKGKNTPFHGWQLTGLPVVTISMGKVYEWL
jgi:dihydroorotase